VIRLRRVGKSQTEWHLGYMFVIDGLGWLLLMVVEGGRQGWSGSGRKEWHFRVSSSYGFKVVWLSVYVYAGG